MSPRNVFTKRARTAVGVSIVLAIAACARMAE
jgi:hypothetical protein